MIFSMRGAKVQVHIIIFTLRSLDNLPLILLINYHYWILRSIYVVVCSAAVRYYVALSTACFCRRMLYVYL